MSQRRRVKNVDKINKIREKRRKDRKKNNKSSLYNRNLNVNKRKRIRKKKNVPLRITFLLLVVVLLFFGVYKLISVLFLQKRANYGQIRSYYATSEYDKSFKEYNKNLYYDNFKKENGVYVANKSSNPNIINIVKNNYEDILFEELNKYLNEKSIKQKDFSIYLEKDGKELLSINEDVKYENYDIKDFINLLLVKHGIENNIFKINDEVTIYKSDLAPSNIYSSKNIGDKVKVDRILNDAYSKGDRISKNIINRILVENKINESNTLNTVLKNSDFKKYSVKDIAKLINVQDKGSTTINSVFDSLFKEDNTLFLSSIYSPAGNKNIHEDKKEYKYDAGIINTSNKYIFSIYSEKLTTEQINDIGDLLNRKIEEIESIKKIHE